MEPLTEIVGRVVPLYRPDVDTDQIMPKQFLKRVERSGFGQFIFFDWRQEPRFILNDPAYAGGNVLVTGANFGSGSSREHAPWGLREYGFEAILAPSFADIFAANCAKVGLLTVVLPADVCECLASDATRDPATEVRIDVRAQTVTCGDDTTAFDIEPGRKRLLLEGLDDIAISLREAAAIARYEDRRVPWMPTTTPRQLPSWGKPDSLIPRRRTLHRAHTDKADPGAVPLGGNVA
jgi:3-isopropylmalate/(R)-2-methylmalate dehydratase small subunit